MFLGAVGVVMGTEAVAAGMFVSVRVLRLKVASAA